MLKIYHTFNKILVVVFLLFLNQHCQKDVHNNENVYGFTGVNLLLPSNGNTCYPFSLSLSNQAYLGRVRFSWTRDTAAQQYLLYAIKKQILDSLSKDSSLLIKLAPYHAKSTDTFVDMDLPFDQSYYWCVVSAKLDTNIKFHPSTLWSFYLQENVLPKSPPDPAIITRPLDDQIINFNQQAGTSGYDSTQNPIQLVFQTNETNIYNFQVYEKQNLVCTLSNNSTAALNACSNVLFKLIFNVQQITGINTGTFDYKITIKSTDTNGSSSLSLEKNFFVNYTLN